MTPTRPNPDPTSTSRLSRPVLLFATALLIAAALVVVGFRSQGWVDTRPDPYGFSELGRNLAEGRGFDGAGVVLRRRGPLYPLMIGAIYTVFGPNPWIVLAVQCILFAATCVLVHDIGKRLHGARTGWIAAWLCLLHPGLLRYVADLHLETLLTFLFTWVIHAGVRFRERPEVRRGAILGIAFGLAGLTKAVVLPWLPVYLILLSLERGRRDGRRLSIPWAPAAAVAIAAGAVIAPWTLRNFIATGGRLVPVTTGFNDAMLRGLVFSKPEYATLGRPPYTDAENECNAWFRAEFAKRGLVWERDDMETERVLGEVVKERIRTDPTAFPRKFVIGIATFWYEMTSKTNSLVLGGLALLAWGFAVAGIGRGGRECRTTWPVLGPCITLNLVLAALLALGRYSVPVLPALMVAAAAGIDGLFPRRTIARA